MLVDSSGSTMGSNLTMYNIAKVLRDANQLVEAKQLGEAHMFPQAISLLILLRSSYSIFESDRDLT